MLTTIRNRRCINWARKLLDFPLEDCLSGAKSRIGVKRKDLPWIEENFNEEFRQSIIDFPKKKLPQIYELIEKYKKKKFKDMYKCMMI